MERIDVRELRRHARRYLDRVRAGETVEIIDRGTLVALLTPPTPARSARDRLVAEGRLIPAATSLTAPMRVHNPRSTSSALDQLRADS